MKEKTNFAEKYMNKKNQQYKDANKFFLKQKEQEEGMHKVPNSGVLYRWIKRGDEKQPLCTLNSIVFVRYSGTLIDGRVFDSTDNAPLPACFVVKDLIPGWQIALTRMRQGDHMEVIIPEKYGYGNKRAGDIPPYSTLCFDIELVKAEIR